MIGSWRKRRRERQRAIDESEERRKACELALELIRKLQRDLAATESNRAHWHSVATMRDLVREGAQDHVRALRTVWTVACRYDDGSDERRDLATVIAEYEKYVQEVVYRKKPKAEAYKAASESGAPVPQGLKFPLPKRQTEPVQRKLVKLARPAT